MQFLLADAEIPLAFNQHCFYSVWVNKNKRNFMYLYDSTVCSEHVRNRNGKMFTVKSKKILLHFRCNNCDKEFTRPKNGKPRNTTIHFCPECPNYSLAQKITLQKRTENKIKKGKEDRGYKEIYVGDNYPYRKSRWVREHIYVMEMSLGYKIPKGMVVHHIDGDKRNNDIKNLILCSVKEHNQCHARIEKIVFDLYKKGIIGFDRESLSYFEINGYKTT